MTAETTTAQVSNNEQKPAPKIEYKCHCNCEYCSGKKKKNKECRALRGARAPPALTPL